VTLAASFVTVALEEFTCGAPIVVVATELEILVVIVVVGVVVEGVVVDDTGWVGGPDVVVGGATTGGADTRGGPLVVVAFGTVVVAV
jgi:hypothetical protein